MAMYKSPAWYEPDEPKVFRECDLCGDDILMGQKYWLIQDMYCCEYCIDECRHTAEADEEDYEYEE